MGDSWQSQRFYVMGIAVLAVTAMWIGWSFDSPALITQVILVGVGISWMSRDG